jgi:hypothetical protein
MSYDLDIYFKDEPNFVPRAHQGATYSVNAGTMNSIEEEDLGPEVAALLKGYRYVCQINIEGDFEAGYAAALDDVERAVEAGGARVDQQQRTLRTRRKIEPLRQVKRGKPVAPPGTLSFWFESDPANQDQLFDAFVDLMAEKLPEALPRRYGPYEPAQFSWEEHGPEHFKMLWKAEGRNAGGFVWLGSPPVKHVFTSIRNDPISFPKGPRSAGGLSPNIAAPASNCPAPLVWCWIEVLPCGHRISCGTLLCCWAASMPSCDWESP